MATIEISLPHCPYHIWALYLQRVLNDTPMITVFPCNHLNCGFLGKLFHLMFFFSIPCNSFIQHVWIGRKGDSKCWQMKTDTGLIEEAGCNDQNNYICEMPASVTSTFYIIHIKKVKLSILLHKQPMLNMRALDNTNLLS